VFLLGIFTKQRGSDRGNTLGLFAGLVSTSVLGDLPGKISPALSLHIGWSISFTWFAFIGAATVLLVGVWFRTPPSALERANERAQQAQAGDDVPLALRA